VLFYLHTIPFFKKVEPGHEHFFCLHLYLNQHPYRRRNNGDAEIMRFDRGRKNSGFSFSVHLNRAPFPAIFWRLAEDVYLGEPVNKGARLKFGKDLFLVTNTRHGGKVASIKRLHTRPGVVFKSLPA